MNCDCIKTANAKLADQGLRLKTSILMVGSKLETLLYLDTERIEPKRGKKPPIMFVTYCPLCGAKARPGEGGKS